MSTGFRNLVFEGGGIKGIAYGGALQVLHEAGILQNIRRVAGTSAGAITAVLLAVGYSHTEVADIVAETDFNDFADDSFGALRDARRLLEEYGIHKGQHFQKWIGQYIERKTSDRDITFKQLKDAGHALDLYLVGTNLSEQRAEIYSYEHTPDLPIRQAARMSMSIPLYFQCVRGGIDDDVIVDGGVTLNYAVNIFDHDRYIDAPENGETVSYNSAPGYKFNYETLGFRLDNKEEIDFNSRDWSNPPAGIDNILDYTITLVSFMHIMANKKHLHKNDWDRTIFIDTLDVMTTDFNLSREKIDQLLESGKQGTEYYMNWRRNESGYSKPV